jgi:hypothetical protein
MANRVQSAYPRSVDRSHPFADRFHKQQRPVATATGTRELSWRPMKTVHTSRTTGRMFQRPTTGIIANKGNKTRSILERFQPNEIERLVQRIDRNDKHVVHVDCLANYRRLIHVIDLRTTPLSVQLMCTLQQRENQIVQHNACHDVRFQSLMDILQPSHGSTMTQTSPMTYHNIELLSSS